MCQFCFGYVLACVLSALICFGYVFDMFWIWREICLRWYALRADGGNYVHGWYVSAHGLLGGGYVWYDFGMSLIHVVSFGYLFANDEKHCVREWYRSPTDRKIYL